MFSFFLDTGLALAGYKEIISKINQVIINPIIVFLFAVATLIFLYGIVEFLANPANEETRDKGKQHIIWGVVGLAIMVSVFGIMQLIINSLGFVGPGNQNIELPKQ